MKLKGLTLSITCLATLAPIVAIVSCGGTDTPNDQKDQITDLHQKLEELKNKLEEAKNKTVSKTNTADIDKLNTEIANLQKELTNLKTQEANAQKPVSVKELTQLEKVQNFQAFQLLNASQIANVKFDELKDMFDANVPMTRGIQNFALTQVGSYLFNLALKLGYKVSDVDMKDLSQPSATDVVSNADKAEVYKYVKPLIDALKVADQTQVDAILSSSEFQNFFSPATNGATVNKMKLKLAGIDFSSFGQSDPVPAGKDDSAIKNFDGFTFETSNKTKIKLFSQWVDWREDYVEPAIQEYQYINPDKPGTLITQLQFPPSYEVFQNADKTYSDPIEVLPAFSKSIEVDGLVPIFPVESSKERDHNLVILEGIVRKMNVVFAPENKSVIDSLKRDAETFNISSNFIGALEYLGTKFLSANGFGVDQLNSAYDQLNNGSHYFKAVELMARGLTGTTFEKGHSAYDADSQSTYNGIIDMAFDHIGKALLPWSIYQGYGSYTIGTNAFAPMDIRNYKADEDSQVK